MNQSATITLTADENGLTCAAHLLRDGRLVAFATETVYGLGADATIDRAVAAIFAAKNRPEFNPLIVHVDSLETAKKFAVFDGDAERLADAFWPGPLTLVAPVKPGSGLSKLVTAGLSTVAIRVPAHKSAVDLLRTFGGPVAAPSANPSGRISPTTAQHVLNGLNRTIAAVVDAGPCEIGLESTIVGFAPAPTLFRPGGLAPKAIEDCLGVLLADPITTANPSAPGQLRSHYAPNAPVRLNAETAEADEMLIGFGNMPCDKNLSPSGDLTEAAANLFRIFHELDAENATKIAVAPIPQTGLGLAINDRLNRAAAPRP